MESISPAPDGLRTEGYDASPDESVRGVNLMPVEDGKIVEALGYAKRP